MADRWEPVQVDGQPMRAFVASPDGPGPFAAIVVIMHGPGVDAFVEEMTRRVAAAGYVGIAPDLYHRQDASAEIPVMDRVRALRDEEIIRDVNATVSHLSDQSSVRADRTGIMGFCMGGRVVYMMAAVNPAFRAAAAFYGGNTMVAMGDGPSPFQRLADTVCPVLGFFGEDDGNPSPEDMKKLDDELTRHGKAHEFHSYPGTGHGYMNFNNESMHREDAARASWEITLAFLERHLS